MTVEEMTDKELLKILVPLISKIFKGSAEMLVLLKSQSSYTTEQKLEAALLSLEKISDMCAESLGLE